MTEISVTVVPGSSWCCAIQGFVIVYAHGRRLCRNQFRHGSTTISYPQFSLTVMRERCLHRCREQSFAIHAYTMSAVGIDVVSDHKGREHC